MHIFREIPFIKPQNDTYKSYTKDKQSKTMKNEKNISCFSLAFIVCSVLGGFFAWQWCVPNDFVKPKPRFLKIITGYAFWPHHHTQNDGTPIQQVTAHWWLPRHSTLDRFANSVWSQSWLHTPPRHKSSQWRVESGRQNKHASSCYFGLYGDTPPPTPSLIYVHYS